MNLKQASINGIQDERQATIRTVSGMKQVMDTFIISSSSNKRINHLLRSLL